MKILNFGSMNIDDVYTVSHFVKPGETIKPISYERFSGGKGLNQSIALARAGAEVYHAGMIGEDGAFLKELLTESGVHTEFVQTVNTPTGRAIIQVEERTGQNCIILFGGANQCAVREQIDAVLSQFGEGDWLLLQNEINEIGYLMEQAHTRGMTVVFNPSPFNASVMQYPLSYVDWFFVNEIEGAAIARTDTPDAIIAGICTRYPDCRVVLTLGTNGACAYDRKQKASHPIFPVDVVDTTGAGDTFTGYFLHAIASGETLSAALRTASAASALAVSKKGAAPSIPTAEEVSNFLKRQENKS